MEQMEKVPLRPWPDFAEKGVIYQLFLRAFTLDGTLKAAEKMLPHLAGLGIDIVYLTPIVEADDDINLEFWSPRQKASGLGNPKNPYRMKDYFKIDPEYGNDADLKQLNLDGYKKMINEAAKTYPNFKAVATTLREVKTATVNDWSAICWADGEIYKAKDYKGLEIMDRVGGGDSFASGLIYGLMTTGDAELAVNYGAAHGALAMTTPGDTTMASKKEVEAIMGGAGARVQR